MSVPQTVAEVLSKHVVLEVESIDRMYLNVYVPQLQAVEGTLKFIRIHRGHKVASTRMVEPITREFVDSIERFAKDNQISLITFEKGQRKDDFAKQQRKNFHKREGVVFIGKAQEKCTVYRTEKRRNPKTKRTYPWIVKSTTLVNHYYFYCIDEDFGPFFLKFCSYFPYNAKLCLNGHEYLKQQLEQKGITYQALENGILSCEDPQALQALCDRLSEEKIDALLRKWLRRLPHPFAQLIFDRRVTKATPGPFRTRVITDGVIPSLHIDYKGTRIQQYHKEGRALRTETTINNTYDFYIGKNLRNLPALRRIGFQANRRLLQVQRISHDCILAEEAFQEINRPVQVTSQRASALRFADPKVQALWRALLLFQLLPTGFSNRQRRQHFASLLGQPPDSLTQGQMTYHLRRLRLHGIVERIPQTHRYRITDLGLRTAWFCTRTYSRILRPGLGSILPELSPPNSSLRRSFDKLHQEVTSWIQHTKLAA